MNGYLDVAGHRLAYRDMGEGLVMVFVHGTPSSSAEFETVMTEMSSRCRCIAIDHLGFGASEKPPTADYSLAAHRERLAAALAQLGVDRFHMVVHDFGGPIALPLLLDQPERALSLTLMSTWLWPLGQTDASLEKQRRFMTSRLVRWLYLNANFSARVLVKAAWGRHRPLTRAHHRIYMDAFPAKDQRHGTVAFLNALFDAGEPTWAMHERTERLRGIPTTIVWGARDIISLGTFERWQQLLPQADAVLLPEVGHFIADEAPELLIPVLERLVGRARAGVAR